ncbi:MAG: hypothetical protein IH585_11360 [Anaerolineaceae bacterium]|nr:hypothetical protein [Anaerolineaceae bacterium]
MYSYRSADTRLRNSRINKVMGISQDQFVQIYHTSGEVRVVKVENNSAIDLY